LFRYRNKFAAPASASRNHGVADIERLQPQRAVLPDSVRDLLHRAVENEKDLAERRAVSVFVEKFYI